MYYRSESFLDRFDDFFRSIRRFFHLDSINFIRYHRCSRGNCSIIILTQPAITSELGIQYYRRADVLVEVISVDFSANARKKITHKIICADLYNGMYQLCSRSAIHRLDIPAGSLSVNSMSLAFRFRLKCVDHVITSFPSNKFD